MTSLGNAVNLGNAINLGNWVQIGNAVRLGPFGNLSEAIDLLINATFSRGGAAAWVRGFDATTGLKLVQTAVDGSAVEGLRLATELGGGATPGPELVTNGDASDITSTDTTSSPLTGFFNTGTHNAANKVMIEDGAFRIISDGTFMGLNMHGVTLEIGATYTYSVPVSEISGSIKVTSGSHTKPISAIGVLTGTFVADATTIYLYRNGACNAMYDNVSVVKVIPTWVNDDGTGATLHPTNADGHYLKINAWPGAAQVVSAGDYCVGKVGNHYYYFQADGAGTTAGSEPVWAASGTITDNDFGWVFKGRYSNLGPGVVPYLLHEPVATNRWWPTNDLTNANWVNFSGTTATANTITFPLDSTSQKYQLITTTLGDNTIAAEVSVASGTKQFRLKGATSTGDKYSPDFTASTTPTKFKHTFTETIAGARTCSIANDSAGTAGTLIVGELQNEAGSVASSHIPTTTAPVTRPATLQTVANPLPANDFQVRFRWVVGEIIDYQYFFSMNDVGTNVHRIVFANGLVGYHKYVDGTYLGGASKAIAPSIGDVVEIGLRVSGTTGSCVAINGVSGSVTAETQNLTLSGSALLVIGAQSNGSEVMTGGITDLTLYTGTDPDWFKNTTWSDA